LQVFAKPCKKPCRTYVLSEGEPSLPQVKTIETNSSLAQRMLGAVDLAVDFATLGEWGLESVPAEEPCRERPGHVTGWEALTTARRGRCDRREARTMTRSRQRDPR